MGLDLFLLVSPNRNLVVVFANDARAGKPREASCFALFLLLQCFFAERLEESSIVHVVGH